ncbi:MAG: molybdenum cofactor biosynthesis protein MoaE [Deinococcales bacterium]
MEWRYGNCELYFFAKVIANIGAKSLSFALEGPLSVRDIASRVEAQYQLSLKGALCAVNEQYVHPDVMVQQGDRLAFFQHGSGRLMMERYYFIVEEALSGNAYFSLVFLLLAHRRHFVGTVRSPNRGQVVTSIDYQGYEAMMKTQMAVIADELEANYQLGVCNSSHPLGSAKTGRGFHCH